MWVSAGYNRERETVSYPHVKGTGEPTSHRLLIFVLSMRLHPASSLSPVPDAGSTSVSAFGELAPLEEKKSLVNRCANSLRHVHSPAALPRRYASAGAANAIIIAAAHNPKISS